MSSSTSDGWGGDYSLLLQSIEGRISENLNGDTSTMLGSPSPDYSSAVKRRRESGGATPSADYSLNSAKKLRSAVELDEVLLENEQLKDQLQRLKSDHQIAREEQIRQIKFLDERCSSFKKESADRLEKYYEEKKKWQTKQRETESLLKKAAEKASSGASVPSSSVANTNGHNDQVTQKLRELERDLQAKVEEARKNMQDKLTLETQLYQAEMELKELRASHGAGSTSDEAVAEARMLRKQFSDLETSHKRMAREQDAMKLKMKNQGLLEEELSSARAKLRIAEETVSALKHIQAEHQQLHGERLLWSQLFQGILLEVRDSDHSDILTDEDPSLSEMLAAPQGGAHDVEPVSPTHVLHLLSAYQRRCAVLLQGQGQLQQTVAEVRRQFREAVKTQRAAEDEAMRLGDQLEKAEHQLRTASQQSRMYTGEIHSLRTLLETYDAEYGIGKRPDAAKVFALKDQLISDLRAQLDGSRTEAVESFTRVRLLEARADEMEGSLAARQDEVRTLEAQLAAATAAAERAQAQLSEQLLVESDAASSSSMEEAFMEAAGELRAEAQEARDQLEYLQYFTGLDYLPDRTRVLHMPMNPSSSVPLTHTVPTVAALKQLRDEHQQLLQLKAQAQGVTGEDARSTSTGSVMAMGEDADQSNVNHLNMSVLDGQGGSSGSGGTHTAGSSSASSSADSHKLNMRLKEMFKERITSFREGVYLLTGYKVDLYAADASNPESLPRLRLRSMFAERPEDCLMFQLRGDSPELLDTDFISRLEPHLLQQLERSNSVPAFLASVTLELFENQTFMG